MAAMGVRERVSEFFSRNLTTYRQVGHIYWQSLRDNFDVRVRDDAAPAPALTNAAKLAQLKTEFDRLEPDSHDLSALFKIEMQLFDLISDEAVLDRYWAVADRFERVVPKATRATRLLWVKPPGAPEWQTADFVRRQAMTLLDQIHANYLVNFDRETASIGLRLLALSVLALTGSAMALLGYIVGDEASLGYAYFMLFSAGVIGAAISLNRRIQTAVAHDALTADGLFELFALRTSRVSSLVSLLFGGVFALVLYLLVASGTLSLLVPSEQSTADLQSAIRLAQSDVARKTAMSRQPATPVISPPPAAVSTTTAGPNPAATPPAAGTAAGPTAATTPTTAAAGSTPAGITAAPPARAADPKVAEAARIADLQQAEARLAQLVELQKTMLPSVVCTSDAKVDTTCAAGSRYAELLGLADARAFYLMLLLALVAGFAERLVPDALDRLARRLNNQS